MTTYDLSANLTDLTGAEIPDSIMGKVLANQLAATTKLNAIKAMTWALSLFKDGTIEIDDVDKKELVGFINGEHCQLTNIAKFPILKALGE